ncbi:methyltransferase family protein [Tumebacillus sp. BK434]|uniref:class I SAM-dependent methyltransferase n=1 Tax=Tumebacillus sp. BK434 TaxID=2512169 RepID=UPI001051BF7C|nr:class I SAM-dependent methyltransferase [Tumebacillus sp. BK434]TCP52828.1 methyltransferase family protein [Tumebacillus sp. BK434]
MGEMSYQDLLALFGIGGAHPGGIALTEEVLAGERLQRTTRVLDVGCGTGQTAAYLARTYGCQVTAVDLHPLMRKKAQERFAKEKLPVKLLKGDANKLPFPSGRFDLVLIESVTVFTDLARSLPEYARVLRPGGVLLDLEMTAERPLSAQELQELHGVYGTKVVPTEAEWIGRLQKAGLREVRTVKGGTVASALPDEKSGANVLPEFNLSDEIDPKVYQIWEQHQRVTDSFKHRLGYRVYRAKKGKQSST